MTSAERNTWPVHVFPLSGAPGSNIASQTTAEERLAMMWKLAVEAWTLAGSRILPQERDKAPVLVLSLREAKGPR